MLEAAAIFAQIGLALIAATILCAALITVASGWTRDLRSLRRHQQRTAASRRATTAARSGR